MALILLWLCIFNAVSSIDHDIKGFDDSILFGIDWPGSGNLNVFDSGVNEELNKSQLENKEVVSIVTTNQEKYQCYLPEIHHKKEKSVEGYNARSPLDLLKPLFSQKICSYRLESYWSYEICHGRYIRQYHEERDGKQLKTQEYFLGYWNSEKQAKQEAEIQDVQHNKETVKTTMVEGQSLPYVEMVMEDGTLCDLNDKPRLTRVQYVCYTHGKHEVYSFKETSTCEYEIIILSPLLCDHPLFKTKEVSENVIQCLPVGDAPKKPRNLLKMEVDNMRFEHHSKIKLINNERDPKDVLAVLKVEKIEKDGETHLKFELHPLNEVDEISPVDESKGLTTTSTSTTDKPLPVIRDDSPVREFLNGENCLNGGTGWWKYEFCYGKQVTQYHVDRTGEKMTLVLGNFNEKAHLDWIRENKSKAPKPLEQRTYISHFYSEGDICDKTGKPRQTEVKLKCLENASSSAQVSLYLLEPRTCHYILGVESPLICEILPLADDNGLIRASKPLPDKESMHEIDLNGDTVSDKDNVIKILGND